MPLIVAGSRNWPAALMKDLRMKRLIFVAAAAALAWPAQAADFLLLVQEAPTELAKRRDAGPAGAAYWQGFVAAGGALAKAGALKGGGALEPISPPGRGGLVLGGYFLISADTLASARSLAARVAPNVRGGRIDVIAHAPTKTGM